MAGFDKKKFDKSKFEPRTELVDVPSLASFFGEGEKPVFKVRGLTGEELARVNESQNKFKNIQAIIDALASSIAKDKVHAIQESLGLVDDIPADLARRITLLRLGCVDPEIDEQMAVKLFKVAAVDCFGLTNQIQILSGRGMMPGELRASGKTQKSKQPSISGTPGANSSTK